MEIEIISQITGRILIHGEYASIRECLEKNEGAYLGGANLGGANLRGAYLEGAKNYQDNHDFFAEVVRRQKVEIFSQAEWAAIGQIVIHRLCWETIKKRFSSVMPEIFQKCADAGFGEWLTHWNSIESKRRKERQ